MESFTLTTEESIRDLSENSGAITSKRVATAGASVFQIQQNVDALPYNRVRGFALQVGYETNATGIVFIAWIIQAFQGGQTHRSLIPFGLN